MNKESFTKMLRSKNVRFSSVKMQTTECLRVEESENVTFHGKVQELIVEFDKKTGAFSGIALY